MLQAEQIQKLTKLKELLDAGVLSEDEFTKAKAEIMSGAAQQPPLKPQQPQVSQQPQASQYVQQPQAPRPPQAPQYSQQPQASQYVQHPQASQYVKQPQTPRYTQPQYPQYPQQPQYVQSQYSQNAPVKQTNGLGVVGFVISLFAFLLFFILAIYGEGMFFLSIIFALAGVVLSAIALKKRPKGFAITGLIIGGIAFQLSCGILIAHYFYGF